MVREAVAKMTMVMATAMIQQQQLEADTDNNEMMMQW